jgi:hypothetical protein
MEELGFAIGAGWHIIVTTAMSAHVLIMTDLIKAVMAGNKVVKIDRRRAMREIADWGAPNVDSATKAIATRKFAKRTIPDL